MPCSTASSRRSRSLSSRTSTAASNAATSRSRAILTMLGFVALVLACASGCGRTVLVKQGSPLRIGPDVHARVYARVNGEWSLSGNQVEIPEGWYLVPPDYVDAE